jgi:hypothetical protein
MVVTIVMERAMVESADNLRHSIPSALIHSYLLESPHSSRYRPCRQHPRGAGKIGLEARGTMTTMTDAVILSRLTTRPCPVPTLLCVTFRLD